MLYNKKIIFLISFFLLIFFYQLFLYQNNLLNYFDYGILFNFGNKIELSDYSLLANDHISIIYLIIKIFDFKFTSLSIYLLLLFKIICLLSVFFLKVKKNLKFYIFLIIHPFIWNYINFSINIDFLFIPLSVLIINSIIDNNFKKLLIWSFFALIIKDTFSLFLIPYLFIFYLKEKEKKSLILILFCSLYLSLIFIKLFFFNDLFYSYNNSIHFLSNFNFESFLILMILILCFYPLYFSNYKITLIPLLIIYILIGNENLFSIYSHYNTYFIAPLIISFNNLKNIFLIKKKILIIFSLLIMQISYSPLSIIFWKNYSSNLVYNIENKRSFYHLEDFLKEMDINSKVVSIQNNLLFKNIYKSNYLLPYPKGVLDDERYYNSIFSKNYSSINADFFIINLKKGLFILDKNCVDIYLDICDKNYYVDEIFLNKHVFKLIYNKNDFKIYKRK